VALEVIFFIESSRTCNMNRSTMMVLYSFI